jgi:hypothetical protein
MIPIFIRGHLMGKLWARSGRSMSNVDKNHSRMSMSDIKTIDYALNDFGCD